MCGINLQQERLNAELLGMGIRFISDAVAILKAEGLPNAQESDVLAAATAAYQQGKITKSQYIAVINALDEAVSTTAATVERNNSWNQEYIEAQKYLDRYRR